MNRRKIKRQIKKINDARFIRMALSSLTLIRRWGRYNNKNSKLNMRILTENFYRNGKLLDITQAYC
jgi:hypothetical protein